MGSFILFCVSIIVIAFLSVLIRKFAEDIFPPTVFAFVAFPGIVLHEIFHALVSFIVGAKVHRIQSFSFQGGAVVHEKPRLPFGQLLISFAPFVGGIASVVFLGSVIFDADGAIHRYRSLTTISFSNLLDQIFSVWFWMWLYALYSVSATMLPSWQDVKNTAAGLAVLFIAGGLMFWASPFSLPSEFLIKANEMLMGYAAPILVTFAAVSFLFFLLRRATRRMSRGVY